MKNIKLIAVDIDGVLVTDTFSPVLRNIVIKRGLEYTGDIERHVFSRPRIEGWKYMMKTSNIDLRETFFEERARYLQTHEHGFIDGVPEFLELVSSLGVKLVCYGGLAEEEIFDGMKKYKHYFDRYVCTNDFRPGIKEITKDIYGLEYNQVLFIDDVNTVAEAAKADNVPFIGTPANFPWGFQKRDMIKTGVKYILGSLKEIDRQLLEKIDYEACIGAVWSVSSE